MQWFFVALSAPFLWAVVNVADNYLVSNFSEKDKERSSGALVLFSSLTGVLIAFLIVAFTPNVFSIPLFDKLLLLICGVLTIVWIVLYLFALEIEETSSVVPWFLLVPVIGYILGYFVLGEKLSIHQLIGSVTILLGLILISINHISENKVSKHKHVAYMFFASLAIAISGVIFKYVTVENNFWVSSFWEYFGLGLSGLFIFLFIPNYREAFLHMHKKGGRKILFVNIFTELLSIAGNLLTNFALLLAPVAMVYIVGSLQPAIVLLLTILTTKFLPHITKENLTRQALVKKITAIFIILLGNAILFF